MANLETLELRISANAQEATKGLGNLISSLESLRSIVPSVTAEMQRLNQQLQILNSLGINPKIFNNMKAAQTAGNMAGESAVQYGMKLLNSTSNQELMNQKLLETGRQYLANAYYGKLNNKQLVDGAVSVKNLQSKVEGLNEKIKESKSFSNIIKTGLKSITGGLSDLASRIKRIATTMLIRKAIKSLVKYAKEGITNLYGWSQTVKGSFASAIDTAKAKVATLKNSLGAMLGPVISALIPLFNSLTSAVISAANWINQFISLLSGKVTWTKAIEQGTEDIEELGKKATGTSDAMKDMIASFDELNVITSSSSGSSGTGASSEEDYTDLFEDIATFDSKIRELSDFVLTNLDTIKTLAIEVGTALLAWKLSTAFTEVLPTLSTILGYVATGAAIAITCALTWTLTNQYLKTGDAGYLWTEILTTAVGATAAAVLAKKLISGQAAVWAASITLTLSALTGITAVLGDSDVSAFSKESVTTLIVNALKAGLAVGILLKTVGGATLLTSAAGAGAAALAVFGVSIGLKASLDPNVELFSVEYIASTVGAAVAVGLAAFLFTPVGVVGAGIAAIATFGVLIAIKLFTKKEDTKWGDLELTQEQINEYVKTRMFDAEAMVRISQYTTILTNKSDLEDSIRSKLVQINTEYDILELGLDTEASYNKIKELIGDENSGLIKDVNDLIDTNIDMLKITFSNITAYDGQGNVLSKETLLSAIPAWQEIQKEMTANGAELTKLLYKGATEQLTESEEKYAQELLEQITSLSQKITSATEFGAAAADFRTAALDAMSKGSIEGITEAFKTYSSQNEETIRSTLKETIASYYALADITDDPTMKAKWTQIADDLSAGFEKTVEEELKKTNSSGADMIVDWFLGQYGEGSIGSFNRALHPIEEILTNEGLTPEGIKTVLQNIFTDNGMTQAELNMMEVIGFTGFDLLSDELQQEILDYITVSPETVQLLKDGLGLDASQIITFSGWDQLSTKEQTDLFNSLEKAYGTSEAVAALKKAVPDISAVDIIKTSNWDKLTSDQQLMLINALGDAFGSEEALNAAKEAGIDVGDAVTKGMNSKSTAVQEAAKKWDKEITDNFDNKTHKTAVDVAKDAKFNEHKDKIASDVENKKIQMKAALAKNSSFDTNKDKFAKEVSDKKTNMQVSVAKIAGEKGFDKTLKTYVDTVNAKSGYVKVGATKKTGSDGFDTALGKITAMVNKKTGTVKAFVTLADGQKVALETELQKLGVNMKVSAAISNMTELVLTLKTKIKETFGTLFTKMGWKWEAEGGIVNSGDIFVANENGKSEMIGRFGNHTGVANQEQMVEAMARGVEYAQASQNSLLREQNALLRAILAKEGNVTIGASSALGRTVKQSLQMYNSMTGG